MNDILGHKIILINLNRLKEYKIWYREIKLESINRNISCNTPYIGKQIPHF